MTIVATVQNAGYAIDLIQLLETGYDIDCWTIAKRVLPSDEGSLAEGPFGHRSHKC